MARPQVVQHRHDRLISSIRALRREGALVLKCGCCFRSAVSFAAFALSPIKDGLQGEGCDGKASLRDASRLERVKEI